MNVTLVMFKSDGTRRDFNLHKDRTIVGRANTADLRIPLSSVSRQHCELWIEGGLLKMRDLGSSNGTFQNSVRVQEALLAPGDEIVIGPVVFTVVIDGLPKVVEPVRTILPEQDEGAVVTQPSAPPPIPVSAKPPPVPAKIEELEEVDAAELDEVEEVKEDELEEVIDIEDDAEAMPLAELEEDDADLKGAVPPPIPAGAGAGSDSDDDLMLALDDDEDVKPAAKPSAPPKIPASAPPPVPGKPAAAASKPAAAAKAEPEEIPMLEEDDPIAALAALSAKEDDDEVIPMLTDEDEPKAKSPPPVPKKK